MSDKKPIKASITYPVEDERTGKPGPGGMTLTVEKRPPPKSFIDEYEKISRDERKPVFPCQPGVKWKDVKFILIADDTVRITTPQNTANFSFQELGMMDKRSDGPTANWHLLQVAIVAGGVIGPKELDHFKHDTLRTRRRTKAYSTDPYKVASNLNKHLQGLFGIDESIYVRPYGEELKYTLRFMVENRTELTLS